MKILIADDDLLTRHMLESLLSKWGYKVIIACDGMEAWKILQSKEAPRLAILDWMMPGMEGSEICRKFRKFPDSERTYFILLTAKGCREDIIEGFNAGANDYISKPFDHEELKARVQVGRQMVELHSVLAEQVKELQRSLELSEINKKLQAEIEQRKKAEAALREREAFLRTVFDAIQDGISVLDRDLNIIRVNKTVENWFYDKYPFIGKKCYQVYQTQKNPCEDCPICRAMKRKRLQKSEVIVHLPDGGKSIREVYAFPLFESNGEIAGAVKYVRDITDKKKAEEKAIFQQQMLIQADKMISLGTLVAGVAHEINNPNGIIMLNAFMLFDVWRAAIPILEAHYEREGDFKLGKNKYSKVRKRASTLFEELIAGAERIKRIVQELKDYARQDTPDLSQTIDLNIVIQSSAKLVSNNIKKATDHFSVQYWPDPLWIRGSFQRLEQVFINLLINACEALKEPEQSISIHTSYDKKKHQVVAQVKDEGEGISEQDLNHVFDPFFTNKRDTGGTGLGLSVSHGIIEEHHGKIFFESTLGKGAVCTVYLPFYKMQG